MYDITLIPSTLSEMPGFKRAFNEWGIYRQEIEKPLTSLGVETVMRKMQHFNSEKYDIAGKTNVVQEDCALNHQARAIAVYWPELCFICKYLILQKTINNSQIYSLSHFVY